MFLLQGLGTRQRLPDDAAMPLSPHANNPLAHRIAISACLQTLLQVALLLCVSAAVLSDSSEAESGSAAATSEAALLLCGSAPVLSESADAESGTAAATSGAPLVLCFRLLFCQTSLMLNLARRRRLRRRLFCCALRLLFCQNQLMLNQALWLFVSAAVLSYKSDAESGSALATAEAALVL
jgi:hypothetical protein